ncbi:hypothetical protein BHM03_00038936 [Ensete ventricosum]|nr:hypothetical protein BHM03_00038936 [Ensete ventricosum]
MANKLNQDLTPINPVASGILVVNPLIFFRRSPYVFPASFPIPLANLLANFGDIPLYRLNSDPMLKLDLGPSFGCNSIDPIIGGLRCGVGVKATICQLCYSWHDLTNLDITRWLGAGFEEVTWGQELIAASPLELVGIEISLELVETKSPLELVETKSLLELIGTKSSLELIGTESLLELVRTKSPLDLVGSESPLELVGTESPLEMDGTESPLEMVWTESSLEIVRTKSLLEMAGTESPLEMVGTESPLEMTRTESLLSGAGQEMPWVLQAIDV